MIYDNKMICIRRILELFDCKPPCVGSGLENTIKQHQLTLGGNSIHWNCSIGFLEGGFCAIVGEHFYKAGWGGFLD